MWSKTTRVASLTGLFLLAAGVAQAGPPDWAMNDGVRTTLPPGPSYNVSSVYRAVPIPATTLILFGAGLLAMPWLRSRKER